MRRRTSKPAKSTPALRRLGLATPPPFVGRTAELSELGAALGHQPLVVVHGAVGSGKTRLARELAGRQEILGGLAAAFVRCYPGDRGAALLARAERELDVLPGGLAEAMATRERLLVIDDIHHLPDTDIPEALDAMCAPEGLGRVLLLTRDVLPLRRDSDRHTMDLDGLDEAAARELWTHLEETYGPTPAGASDAAIARTRGMPLALRREYARAATGKGAWTIAKLPAKVRRALEAVAVLRIPSAPAAAAALTGEADPESALIELVSRQLIDPLEDGRFAIHDVVRDEVLECIDAGVRVELECAAARLVASTGRGVKGEPRLAWDAGDDGAIGVIDPIDRLRETALHYLAAGDSEAAIAHLDAAGDSIHRRGAGGEILALAEQLAAGHAGDARLIRIRADIAARQGRVVEALEIAAGGSADGIELAACEYAAGNVDEARARLTAALESDAANERARAAALLAEIELACGDVAAAEALAAGAFTRDRAALDDSGRARLHLSLAAVEDFRGRFTAARAALARAAGAGRIEPQTAALIDARRAFCLAREGRISEALAALESAERCAREVDAVAIADEIRRCNALVDARRGSLEQAATALSTLVARRRRRGDEVGALTAELDVAQLAWRRGELAAAAEVATACLGSAERRGLHGLGARARLVLAAVELSEMRLDAADVALRELAVATAAPADVRAEAAALGARARAWSGSPDRPSDAAPASSEGRDELELLRDRAHLALAAGDSAAALEAARALAVRADRSGRAAEVAEGLALAARLQLARGDKAGATASATRAAREALTCGLSGDRAGALLVLAALARDDGDVPTASAYARDAARLAADAGLPIERLVATAALDAIAGSADAGDSAGAVDSRSAAAATMSQAALDATARMLADLGLTAVRPYRVVSAAGSDSYVADANPDLLRMAERNLAIDGVREVIVRDGEQVADLRRRSLLKRLLFLFAGAPGHVFSKEDIVQTVWEVEYHPLRHDAALFTNIMRIRRLLGDDGADLIRVGEDGYRFEPPKDFLFVENTQA